MGNTFVLRRAEGGSKVRGGRTFRAPVVVHSLSGQIDITSTVAANVNPFRGFSGTIDITLSISSNLYVVWALTGTISAVATLVAILETDIPEPFRPPIGQAVGSSILEGTSRQLPGLAAHGTITATPIPPGRGKGSRTPSAVGSVTALPPGLAGTQAIPRSGSAGVARGIIEGHGVSPPTIPSGGGKETPPQQDSEAKPTRTREGEAKPTDEPLPSGKAR